MPKIRNYYTYKYFFIVFVYMKYDLLAIICKTSCNMHETGLDIQQEL